MKTASIYNGLEYLGNKPAIKILLDTSFTKEIRISFRTGQIMKEHKTPYPIVVHVIEGQIDFGVNGKILKLITGDLIALEGNVPHDLLAKVNSIVRLTLTKNDATDRVEKVVNAN